MKITKVDLYKYFNIERGEGYSGFLTCYVKDNMDRMEKKRMNPGMLVIPGGGYQVLSVKEGEPVVIAYLNQNFNCFLLDYTTAPNGYYPTQLIEASMAMIYIKKNYDKLYVNKDSICACGFSAGGHLCACLATLYHDETLIKLFKEDCELIKPKVAVLAYAVLSRNVATNEGTYINVSNNNLDIMKKLSLDDWVTSESAPAFIWTTANDQIVPAINSIVYAEACANNNVPYEIHVFGKGYHGSSTADEKIFSICTEENFKKFSKYLKYWVELSVAFMKEQGIKMELEDF